MMYSRSRFRIESHPKPRHTRETRRPPARAELQLPLHEYSKLYMRRGEIPQALHYSRPAQSKRFRIAQRPPLRRLQIAGRFARESSKSNSMLAVPADL